MNRPIALAHAIAGLSAAIAIITVATTTMERPVPPLETSLSEVSEVAPTEAPAPEVVYVDESGRPLIDGGGDLRGSGRSFAIGAMGGHTIDLQDGGVATSSTRERRRQSEDGCELHHILDPLTRRPSGSALVTATVRAADATTADVLATALLVCPEAVAELLAGFGASALVEDRDGNRWTTPSWKEAA